MALTPAQLDRTLEERALQIALRMEEDIDKEMERRFFGGVFKYVWDDVFSPSILDALRQKYPQWDVRHRSRMLDDRQVHTLEFIPHDKF